MSFIVKLAFFSIFITLVYFAIGLVMKEATSLVLGHFNVGNNVLYILHRLKICEAVNLFLSFYIATWMINKLINYWM